jgi:hypothetical protein
MMKRREINKLLVASAFLPLSANLWSSVSERKSRSLQGPVHFIYEKKAIDYGLKVKPSFIDFEKIHYIEGDVTRVWYDELHFLWQKKSILTAGLTRESEFFILRTLARDYGYNVVHEEQLENSQLISWLLAPQKLTFTSFP